MGKLRENILKKMKTYCCKNPIEIDLETKLCKICETKLMEKIGDFKYIKYNNTIYYVTTDENRATLAARTIAYKNTIAGLRIVKFPKTLTALYKRYHNIEEED